MAGNIVRMVDKRNRYRSLVRNPGSRHSFSGMSLEARKILIWVIKN
jgi:hypothetical protein